MAYRLGKHGHPEYLFDPDTDLDHALHCFSVELNPTAHVPYIEDMFREIMRATLASAEEACITALYDERRRRSRSLELNCVGVAEAIYDQILFTRSNKGGGLTTISYMMAKVWHDIMGWGGETLLYHFIYQYGCWKDMKRFCLYAVANGWTWSHPVIQYAILLTNMQIKIDLDASIPSFAAKWVPREKRQGAILFRLLAENYFGKKKGGKREYRMMISLLSSRLPLLEHVLQLPSNEECVDSNKIAEDVASRSYTRSHLSFYGVFRKRAALFRRSIGTLFVEPSKRMNLGALVKAALYDPEEYSPLLIQGWNGKGRYDERRRRSRSLELNCVGVAEAIYHPTPVYDGRRSLKLDGEGKAEVIYTIPCVDLSMADEDARCRAMGIGLQIAEASFFKRVLVFSAKGMAWLDVETTKERTFVDKVRAMNSWASAAGNQDIYPVFEWIMESIAESDMDHEEVEAMEIVVLTEHVVQRSPSPAIDDRLKLIYPILPKISYGVRRSAT